MEGLQEGLGCRDCGEEEKKVLSLGKIQGSEKNETPNKKGRGMWVTLIEIDRKRKKFCCGAVGRAQREL